MEESEQALINKLQEIKELFPKIPPKSIKEIINLCFSCKNPSRVIFRIEEYTRAVWPSYRTFVVHLIDSLCDITLSKNPVLTEYFKFNFSFRLIEILTLVALCRDEQKKSVLLIISKWKNNHTFDISLCEELESFFYSTMHSLQQKENKSILDEGNNNVPQIQQNYSTDTLFEHRELSEQQKQIKPRHSRSRSRSFSYHSQDSFNFQRSYSNSPKRRSSPRQLYYSQSRDSSKSIASRRLSPQHSPCYSPPQKRLTQTFQRFGRDSTPFCSRNERKYSPPRSTSRHCNRIRGRYSFSSRKNYLNDSKIPQKDSYLTIPSNNITLNSPTNKGNKVLGNNRNNKFNPKESQEVHRFERMTDEEQAELILKRRKKLSLTVVSSTPTDGDSIRLKPHNQPLNCQNTTQKINVYTNNLIGNTTQPKLNQTLKETIKLIKTNVIVFCDIPVAWKTQGDVLNYIEHAKVSSIEIILEHKCCTISFINHEDALKWKVRGGNQHMKTLWGKEVWMKTSVLRDDGIVEVPLSMIPKNVTIMENGTYKSN
ncbi:hypothetical protein EDI_202820 [Entamoeba dispar SAW760]|uniref:CID domain-containing protein n=1 Tax=Entamoeba dispar (strain ATCC PRA-260 / SAW760) TaxID=370354 RepID=B0ETA7_ENTDS|nr:uncharacterized protein EDI_202820 [Entamoeba dispar SAW760]EDR22267.1 hypothetical protein EDI_202820 [Entamoeba dispar SAW760]|eukprot:EDR22267.1 hypothetical protein EDI_202820 [Entamoeba dispar SAW760]